MSDIPSTTRQVVLASRPHGAPTQDNFRVEAVDLPELTDGQVLVRNVVMSVDPSMRGRMNESASYIPHVELGHPLDGRAVGEVIASRTADLAVGDHIRHDHGWREHAVLAAEQAHVVDVSATPASAHLGVLGIPGFTAWVGLTAVAELREGDTVFVSGAAGAVGQAAGQIARELGAARVVGSAGSAAKVERLLELGYDAAFNYKEVPVLEGLRAVAPDGIDVYFDNVGGDHLEAAIDSFRDLGRAALCGAISTYNATEPTPAPTNLRMAIGKCLTLRGFVVRRHLDQFDEFQSRASAWVASGRLHGDETFRDGLDSAPQAFIDLLEGANTGKMLVRL